MIDNIGESEPVTHFRGLQGRPRPEKSTSDRHRYSSWALSSGVGLRLVVEWGSCVSSGRNSRCRHSVKERFMVFRFIIPATVPVHSIIAPEPHIQGIGDLDYILCSKVHTLCSLYSQSLKIYIPLMGMTRSFKNT